MKPLYKNILIFTGVLAITTLSVEWFRKGHLHFEEPLTLVLTIFVLGIVGGYLYTWTYENKS
jgi:hypothetical protein